MITLYKGERLTGRLYGIWAEKLRIGNKRVNRIFGFSIGWFFFGLIYASPIEQELDSDE